MTQYYLTEQDRALIQQLLKRVGWKEQPANRFAPSATLLLGKAVDGIATNATGSVRLCQGNPPTAGTETRDAVNVCDEAINAGDSVLMGWCTTLNGGGFWGAWKCGTAADSPGGSPSSECMCSLISLLSSKDHLADITSGEWDTLRETCDCVAIVPEAGCFICQDDGATVNAQSKAVDVYIEGLVLHVESSAQYPPAGAWGRIADYINTQGPFYMEFTGTPVSCSTAKLEAIDKTGLDPTYLGLGEVSFQFDWGDAALPTRSGNLRIIGGWASAGVQHPDQSNEGRFEIPGDGSPKSLDCLGEVSGTLVNADTIDPVYGGLDFGFCDFRVVPRNEQ